jgi:hypothetical protein
MYFLLLRQSRRGGAGSETAITSVDTILPEFFLDAEKLVVSTFLTVSSHSQTKYETEMNRGERRKDTW